MTIEKKTQLCPHRGCIEIIKRALESRLKAADEKTRHELGGNIFGLQNYLRIYVLSKKENEEYFRTRIQAHLNELNRYIEEGIWRRE